MLKSTPDRSAPPGATRRVLRSALAVCLLGLFSAPAEVLGGPLVDVLEPRGDFSGFERAPSPQEVSSFYLQLYESGRKAFREKRFRDAASDLEIAVFGLAKDKTLYGKAQIYLAICFNYLAIRSKVEPALMQAARLLGPDDVKALGLDEEVLALLRKLVEEFRMDLELPPPPGSAPVEDVTPDPSPATPKPVEKAAPPVSAQTAEKTAPPVPDLVFVQKAEESRPAAEPVPPPKKKEKEILPDIKPLERRLKSESDNPLLVEEIVNLYFKRGEPKKAKAVLEKYLETRPSDLSAVLSLARANYHLKEYKTAMDGLQALSTPAAEASLTREARLRVAIYKALCLYSMGQESSVSAYLNFVTANLGPDDLSRILEEEDLGTSWAFMLGRLKR